MSDPHAPSSHAAGSHAPNGAAASAVAEAPAIGAPNIDEVDSVIIRFAGDSGDGMQLTGTQFTNTAAVVGNDISTMPDFPAEIRAPAGTLAGVSGFQVHFSSLDILTPGDAAQVLVAMNPAALKSALSELVPGGTIIVNTDEFNASNLKKAAYATNPLEDGSLKGYKIHPVPLTRLNRDALKDIEGLTTKDMDRSKNLFALGLSFWIYDRPLDNTLQWIEEKFGKKPAIFEANRRALMAGYHFGETTEAFQRRFHIPPANLAAGQYRKITGNEAVAIGLVAAAVLADKSLVYCSYPITPASDILHSLAALKNYDVRTFQAEDEIAAMGAAIGAAFGGAFAVTGTSGPGLALKSEAMNLALVLELPMVIVDVQRGGPSTGSPTKTEQSDLLQAMFGRNGESPLPILAPATPGECFDITVLAFRLAARIMSPVIVLSDGYLANSAEPWRIPDVNAMAPIQIGHPTAIGLNGTGFLPFARDAETMARPWALPGTPGLEHRIGGLSKEPGTGNVSYDPIHTQQMNDERRAKVAGLADYLPEQDVYGPESGDLLVLGWGGTFGALRQAVIQANAQGKSVAHAHVRYLNPFPRNLAAVLGRYKQVLVPELNGGQLALLIQGRFLKPVIQLEKLQGQPFRISEIRAKIDEILG
ncbi:MAG: 2-oxoacid:acceptor oxidoreductase subunit alpha [Ardenticatenales bacterium]|nr:2-oxoacid:acceptor oxidoreductase subunit alpha [Ardenticatenales bacterium]